MMGQMVINNLVTNDEFLRKVQPHLCHEYFETEGERVVFGLIDQFVTEYGDRPTVDALAVGLDKLKTAEKVYDECCDVLGYIEPSIENLDWLVNSTETWARRRAVRLAINESMSIYSGDHHDGLEIDAIPEILQTAVAVKFDNNLGHIYWEMAAEHYDTFNSVEYRIPFGVHILNVMTDGGVAKKTLNIVVAGINAGKSTFLIDRAVEAIESGRNCIYYTFEVAESVIRHRCDVRLLGLDFDAVKRMTKPEYLERLRVYQEKNEGKIGKLIIKEYPSGGAHVGHMRSHLKETEAVMNTKIDMICVDYIGEMASSRLPPHMMGNTNTYYGSIARELRAFGIEFDMPVWTAVQFDRNQQKDTQGGKEAGMGDIADAISIPKVADFMISIAQPEDMAYLNQAYGKAIKNRYADKNKLGSIIIGLDQSKQRTYDVDYEAQREMMSDAQIQFAKAYRLPHNGPNSVGDDVEEWDLG